MKGLYRGKTGIVIRTFIVLAPFVVSHLVARVLSRVILDDPYREIRGNEYFWDEASFDWVLSGPATEDRWYTSWADTWQEQVAMHLISLGIVLVGSLVLYVMLLTASWALAYIMGWETTKPDPCQDPKCRCQRHVVERQEAERNRTMMIAAATAAVTSSIMSN